MYAVFCLSIAGD